MERKAFFRYNPDNNELHICFKFENIVFNINKKILVHWFKQDISGCLNAISKKIKQEIPQNCEPQGTIVQLLTGNEPISKNAKIPDILANNDELILKILDENYSVNIFQPINKTLKRNAINFPTVILSENILYPNDCQMELLRKSYKYGIWYKGFMPKSENKNDWIKIHESKNLTYLIQTEDIGYFIKISLHKNQGNSSPDLEIISQSEVKPQSIKNRIDDIYRFRVMTYNILADLKNNLEYFKYCPKEFIDIGYRKSVLIDEILSYEADIICLQEVDENIFNIDFKYFFEKESYDGHYFEKSPSFGIATYFNTNRFSKLKIVNENLTKQIPDLKCFEDQWMKLSVRNANGVLQITIVKSKETNNIILIANAHLYYHKDGGYIRLLQFVVAMNSVEEHYKNIIKDIPIEKVSIIFCGDLNSLPKSGVYKLITEKLVDENIVDWKSNNFIKGMKLYQPFDFKSAYDMPKFTNYTETFKECIDYIFYEPNKIELQLVIPLPDEEILKRNVALPSKIFPSDHLPLVADFKWKSNCI